MLVANFSEYTNSEIGLSARSGQEEREGSRRHLSAGEKMVNSRIKKGRNGKDGANSKSTDVEKERTCWCFSPL